MDSVASAVPALAAPDEVLAAIAERWLRDRDVAPALGDVTLLPHQTSAAGRLLDLLDAHGGAMLADEPGLGKTYVALAVARRLAHDGGLLVVAPASLRSMWADAMRRARVGGHFSSFEALSRHGASTPATHGVVVVDEAHHARNPRTRRYRALAQLAWGARVLLLTATPVHNRLADLRAQMALFLGARAESAEHSALLQLVVRRRCVPNTAFSLPRVEPLRWLAVEPDRALVRAVLALPPAVPPADGGTAHALLRLGLLRAASSSDGALRAALRRRLARASALTQALESGRLPDRRELRAWSAGDDAVQLGFPELLAQRETGGATASLLAAVSRHVDGIRSALDALERSGDRDSARTAHLRALLTRHADARIVALTGFHDTASALYRRLAGDPGVALVTGRGGCIASGSIPRREIIARFARPSHSNDHRRLPLRLLLATDVLSEGLDLQGASVLVHLDLPWTVARLEQRIGRLRRIGSSHGAITLYAMGTAVSTRQLFTVMRTLHRKARLVEALTGFSEFAAHAPLLGPRRQRRDAGREDLASEWEAVRDVLAGVRRPGAPAMAREAEAPLLAVAVASGDYGAWRAVALASIAGRPRLVALSAHTANEHPRAVRQLVEEARRALEGEQARASPGAVREALHQALAWLEAREGERLLAPVLDAPSRSHARALRLLEGALSRAPRHERAGLSPRIEEGRGLVLAARGAGAERALAGWVAALHASSARAHARPEDVTRLRDLLARSAGSRPSAANGEPLPVLLALLVLIPSPGAGDLGA